MRPMRFRIHGWKVSLDAGGHRGIEFPAHREGHSCEANRLGALLDSIAIKRCILKYLKNLS